MFLVAGGYGPDMDRLDPTEIFDPLVGTWTQSGARLPRPIGFLRAENIDDSGSVLLFGNYSFLVRLF